MLLWLIGGSPPVRARRKIFYDDPSLFLNKGHDYTPAYSNTTWPILHFSKNNSSWQRRLDKNNRLEVTKNQHYISHSIQKSSENLAEVGNRQKVVICNEPKQLAETVNNAEAIIEVNVVSKSVVGKGIKLMELK